LCKNCGELLDFPKLYTKRHNVQVKLKISFLFVLPLTQNLEPVNFS
jgi:hypothetical protein